MDSFNCLFTLEEVIGVLQQEADHTITKGRVVDAFAELLPEHSRTEFINECYDKTGAHAGQCQAEQCLPQCGCECHRRKAIDDVL